MKFISLNWFLVANMLKSTREGWISFLETRRAPSQESLFFLSKSIFSIHQVQGLWIVGSFKRHRAARSGLNGEITGCPHLIYFVYQGFLASEPLLLPKSISCKSLSLEELNCSVILLHGVCTCASSKCSYKC